MGGGGGRGEHRATGTTTIPGQETPGDAPTGPDLLTDPDPVGLFGPPGPALAAAVQALVDPVTGPVPAGFLPTGASAQPWAEVVHAVVASRRLSGWLLSAQLSMLARWLTAWRSAPPVSDDAGEGDRCETADPALAERLNTEVGHEQRRAGGRLAPLWGGRGQAEMYVPALISSELSLATGLSRWASDQHVDVADAVFLRDRLPRLRRLLAAGRVDWAKLHAFVRETEGLDLVVAHAVERIVLGDPDPAESLDVVADPTRPGLGLPPIARMTLPELRAAIRAAIAAIDAEAAARRAQEARARRRTRCQTNEDGTATLSADMAVEAAAAVWNSLTAAARAARAAGDPRTLDQLRTDTLVARATGTEPAPPLPEDTGDGAPTGTAPAETAPAETAPAETAPAETAPAETAPAETAPAETDDVDSTDSATGTTACHACGQPAGAARERRAGQPVTVNLTLPLATYLALADDPGQLDGYGPVAAGVARQIIRDAGRAHGVAGPSPITWRCVLTDDVHGTVLGIGTPIRVPRHDPSPRLADLVRAAAPTCCFPGCRIRARDCDLDHRIPYDPGDPNGERGGGPTCSCNLGPLCRTHHRLKTAGLIHVRVVDDDGGSDTGVVPGTIEFTTSTGLRYRRAPARATPPAPDLDDLLVATAVAHAGLRAAQRDDDGTGTGTATGTATGTSPGEDDPADQAWQRSHADHTRRRLVQANAAAERRARADDVPPF